MESDPASTKRFSIRRLLILMTAMSVLLHLLLQSGLVLPKVVLDYYNASSPQGKLAIVSMAAISFIYLFATVTWAVMRFPNLLRSYFSHRTKSNNRRAELQREVERARGSNWESDVP